MQLWFVVSLLLASFVVTALACDWQPTVTATSSATSLTLKWNEFPCGVAPTRYIVNVVHGGSNLFVSNANTTTVDVLNLSPCTIYHVRICVKGGPSSCTPTQFVATTCEAPVLLSMIIESTSSSLSSATIRLSWESPEFNEALDYYRVRCAYGCNEGTTKEWDVVKPFLLIPNIDLRKEYIFDVTSISKFSVPGFSTGSISEHKLSTYKLRLVDSLLGLGSLYTRAALSPRSDTTSASSESFESSESSDTSTASSETTTGSGTAPSSSDDTTSTGDSTGDGSIVTGDPSSTTDDDSTITDDSTTSTDASTTTDDSTTTTTGSTTDESTTDSTNDSSTTGDLTTGMGTTTDDDGSSTTTGDLTTGESTTGGNATDSSSSSNDDDSSSDNTNTNGVIITTTTDGESSGYDNSTTTNGDLTTGTSTTTTGNTTFSLTSGTTTSIAFTTGAPDGSSTGGAYTTSTGSVDPNATTGYTSTGDSDLTSSTSSTYINPNATTSGGDLTSGTSTYISTANSTSTPGTTSGGAVGGTTGTAPTISQVKLQIGMNGNATYVNKEIFITKLADALLVNPSQVTNVSIEQTNPSRDPPNYTKRSNQSPRRSSSDTSFVCKAIILYHDYPPNYNPTIVTNALNDSTSQFMSYFSTLNITIVSVNYTIENTTGDQPPYSTAAGMSLSTSSSGSHLHITPKPNLNIAVPVGIIVPSVVILGAAGGFIFVKYRRNRLAAIRARQWDMHNMYSGLSMVDYA